MDMAKLLDDISQKAKSTLPGYMVDGIEYCAECRTPRQKRITICGSERIVNMMCQCRKAKLESEENERRCRAEAARIKKNISVGIRDSSYRDMTFENSDIDLRRERNYCEQFPTMQKTNTGLMFLGGYGTGKTFRAACIANQLLRHGYSVYMDNITSLCASVQGHFTDMQDYINAVTSYDLLILDDIGAERRTDYMIELVYNIIDTRYRTRKPLIVTSNISIAEMKAVDDCRLARTYDRLLEMCSYPITLTAESRRRTIANDKFRSVKELIENGI